MSRERLIPVEMHEPARKTIKEWPISVRQELGAILIRLQRGEFVGMPDIRAMPTVAKGVFEVRIRSSSGAYRAFYVSISDIGIMVFHAFVKKTQQTPQKEIEAARGRLQASLRAL